VELSQFCPAIAEQKFEHDLIQIENGDGGKVLEIAVAPDPAAPRGAIWTEVI
jgi:hypothetical protein